MKLKPKKSMCRFVAGEELWHHLHLVGPGSGALTPLLLAATLTEVWLESIDATSYEAWTLLARRRAERND